jgi:hypothetical protein
MIEIIALVAVNLLPLGAFTWLVYKAYKGDIK